jgi:hypothetical protein
LAIRPQWRRLTGLGPFFLASFFDAAQRLDLEGIVAKCKANPYRPETVWYNIKGRTYTQGEGRWELFQKK